MTGQSRRRRVKQPEPEMNVTPLVDVVLVLLIIFMVVTPALAQGETVDLPSVFELDKRPKDMNPLKLVLAANGRTLLEQREIDTVELAERLKAIRAKDETRQILMITDSKVPYRRVREMLALLQQVGLKGVSLKVNPKKEGT